MAAGHLAMASERFFLAALLLLILGAGCVIGNMAAQVGQLYAPDDHRRTRAFGLYLLALNIGALTAPLIVGTLGEKMGWHWGFGAAGFGMLAPIAAAAIIVWLLSTLAWRELAGGGLSIAVAAAIFTAHERAKRGSAGTPREGLS